MHPTILRMQEIVSKGDEEEIKEIFLNNTTKIP